MAIHLDEYGQPRIIERRFVVEPELSGSRVDHYLVRKIPRLSRTKLQRIIRDTVSRDRQPLKPHTRVFAGETLVMRREAQPEPDCPRTFAVLYEDDRVLVVDKPAGLPVHASAKFYFNTLSRLLFEHYPDEPVQICHRLDRETSGALVVARDREAACVLKRAFETKRAHKRYLAIVHGNITGDAFTIDEPLRLIAPGSGLIDIRMVVADDGAPAQTRVTVVARKPDYTLVSCSPITGRQHQIRVHLAHIGYPIVGDKLYGHGDEAFVTYCERGLTDELAAKFVLPRHALHAAAIEVDHPAGHVLAVEAPLAADLARFWG